MPYIHELKDWPRFHFEPEALAAPLAAVRLKQGRHLGRCEALGLVPRTETRVLMHTQEIVRSSAVEGESVDAELVRASVARRLSRDAEGQSAGASVEGLVSIALDATERFQEPMSKERLIHWHHLLFALPSRIDHRLTIGAYRSDARGRMQVVSGPMGFERVHFQAPPAAQLAEEMDAFLRFFESESAIDPLLQAGIEHLWFLTIHPFDDGNGRLARALTELRFARTEKTSERFYSMSSAILALRPAYYRALESAQRASLDITSWLLWFLECFDHALDLAAIALEGVLSRSRFWQSEAASSLNERMRKVLFRLCDNFQGHLTSSRYAKIARCSQDTALRDIQALLALGLLTRNQKSGRSTSYRVAPPKD